MTTRYSRFFKTDLQMQTPCDPHWRESSTKLAPDADSARRAEVAKEYLRACHAAGLEVVGVTDHNFAHNAAASLINEFRSWNVRIAQESGRQPLTIFPGFEIEANVGKGCHVLCIFPPRTPLEVVEARLTALGLPPDRRFDDSRPLPTSRTLAEIIEVIQTNDAYAGVVIAAHPTSTNGLFDNDRVADWLQVEEFTNASLLCLEVPKPPSDMAIGWQRLLSAGAECEERWRRKRSIACVMSSDCYRLAPSDEDGNNVLGSRFTWIRMTEPSIEALRQAFLDHESRVRYGEHSPDESTHHSRIVRATVTGTKFLRRTESIDWSPNLNCVIGSRGTGKSSLVDYLRFALDRTGDDDIAAGLRDEVRQRVTETLTPLSRIEVTLSTPGGLYRVLCEGQPARRSVFVGDSVIPDTTIDIRTLFPCRFLSQREIDQSFGKRDRATMRRLLDDFVAPRLRLLTERIEDLQNELNGWHTEGEALHVRAARRTSVETELIDLRGQLAKQEQLNSVLPSWNGSEAERRVFERIRADVALVAQRTEAVSAELSAAPWSLASLGDDRMISEAGAAYAGAERARATFADALSSAVRVLQQAFEDPGGPFRSAYTAWELSRAAIESRFRAAQEAASDGGATEDATEIPNRILEAEARIVELDAGRGRLVELDALRSGSLVQLRQLWQEQTDVRREKAQGLMARLSPMAGSPPLVRIEVLHQADREQFFSALLDRIPDRRRVGEADIQLIVDALAAANPESLVEKFVNDVRDPEMPIVSGALDARRHGAFREAFTEAVLARLEQSRINDTVTYTVYRTDGTLAGPIDRVSAGQQGTAILNILLAEGEDPLIVDTPEEGLDSEGVYAELVPLFRRAKRNRQILVVTHNANIPVNADAENIVSLDACGYVEPSEIGSRAAACGVPADNPLLLNIDELLRFNDWQSRIRVAAEHGGLAADVATTLVDALGSVRAAESRIRMDPGNQALAAGGLDLAPVKRAVQDVMEGSEDAFERRRDMYGY